MRYFLCVSLLSICLSGLTPGRAAADGPVPVSNCFFCVYPNICYAHTYRRDKFFYCVQGPGGIYLEPRAPYWNFAASDHTVEFFKDVDAAGFASILNAATGWGVDAQDVDGLTFVAGTYTGSVADIAKEIANTAGADVSIDQATAMITIKK